MQTSEVTEQILGALISLQAELKPVVRSKVVKVKTTKGNYEFKYAPLDAITEYIIPVLQKHGLAFLQAVDDGLIATRIIHKSGQWIESTVRITPAKNDIKTIESYTNFMKRLAYGSIVGIISEGDDDDGEIEMVQAREIVAKGPSTKYDPKKESFESITKEQLEELEYELAEHPDIGESVLDGLRILSLADMPKSQFMKSLQRIREIKQLRNGK